MTEFTVPQQPVSALSSASLVSALPHQLIEQKETEITIPHAPILSSVSSLPNPHHPDEQEQDHMPKPELQNGASAIPKFDDMSALQVGLILLRYVPFSNVVCHQIFTCVSLGLALFMFAIGMYALSTSPFTSPKLNL